MSERVGQPPSVVAPQRWASPPPRNQDQRTMSECDTCDLRRNRLNRTLPISNPKIAPDVAPIIPAIISWALVGLGCIPASTRRPKKTPVSANVAAQYTTTSLVVCSRSKMAPKPYPMLAPHIKPRTIPFTLPALPPRRRPARAIPTVQTTRLPVQGKYFIIDLGV